MGREESRDVERETWRVTPAWLGEDWEEGSSIIPMDPVYQRVN